MRIKWFEFRDHHTKRKPWIVWIVDEFAPPGPGGWDRLTKQSDAAAATDVDRREIEILATNPKRYFGEFVAHEVGIHAAMGDHAMTQTRSQRDGEEYVARQAERPLWRIMTSLGVRLPPLPAELAALRRSARRKARKNAKDTTVSRATLACPSR